MRTAQLNSGSFKKYTAIGLDGSPVWHNAEAFRSALARDPKVGVKYANFLAEPKFNESNDRVDWYIPFESTRSDGQYSIISWNSASPAEKRAALVKLNEFEEKMSDFGLDIQARALTGDSKLFAHFLTGAGGGDELPAIRFPDESCIFIVDGQPVITFWGFIKAGSKPSGSPFASLRSSAAGTTGSATKANKSRKGGFSLWFWLLPLLFLLLLFLGYLLWHFLKAPGFPFGSVMPDFGNLSLDPVPSLLADGKERQELQREIDRLYGTEQNRDGSVVIDVPENNAGIRTDVRTDLNFRGTDGTAAVPGETDLNLQDPDTAVTVPAAEGTVPDGTVTDGTVTDGTVTDGTTPQIQTDPIVPTDKTERNESLDGGDVPAEVNPETSEAVNNDPAVAADSNAQNNETAVPPVPDTKDESQTVTPDGAKTDEAVQNQGSDASDANAGTATEKPLELTDQDVNNKNLNIIDGKWSSRSGLIDSQTGKPVNVQYDFKDGKGTATVTRSDGTKCVGQTSGKFNNGALEIDGAAEAKCADGKGYALPKIICKNENGKTKCQGAYSDNSRLNMELFK
ncbi:MAG: hypothetical protein J6M93_01750 [Succinivibrio sp.]|nr:hypothetical protein [Succinivibrio sp.]